MKPPRLLTAAAALAMAAVMPVPAAGGWLTGHWSRNGETVTYAGGAAFGWAVRERPPYRDGWVEVRFKPVAGREDRAGGVVWRWRDPENYYVAPANALEDNVVAYKVVKGRRTDLTPVDARPGAYGVKIPVAAGAWHTLRVDFAGDRFEFDQFREEETR